MRASREQFAENRQRILEVAGRLFRQKGFEGIGVDGIMKAAGLTHGGFYGHFASKAHLAEEACSAGLAETTRRLETLARDSPEAALADIARDYLTKQHLDDPGNGCVFAALGGDVARSSKAVRSTVTKGIRAAASLSGCRRVGQRARARSRRSRHCRAWWERWSWHGW